MRKILSVIICCMVLVMEMTGCSTYTIDEEAYKTASALVINDAEELFDGKFDEEEIQYDAELKIFDILISSKEKNMKIWYQVSIDDAMEDADELTVITVVAPPLMEYGLNLAEDSSLRNAQAKALLYAKSTLYTRNIAIVSDYYDENNKKYQLKLITADNNILELEVDMVSSNIKML